MNISISIHYCTTGDLLPTLYVVDSLGTTSYAMDSLSGDLFRSEIQLSQRETLEYYFGVGERLERTTTTLDLPLGYDCYVIEDHWHDGVECPALGSSPFLNIFNPAPEFVVQDGNVRFSVDFPYIHHKSQRIALVGSCEALGNWDPQKAPILSSRRFPQWEVSLALDDLGSWVEYKYVVLQGNQVVWEQGDNRLANFAGANSNTFYLKNREGELNIEPQLWRGAGVAIPLFSLRSESSAGIGDFADLEKFTKWSAEIGARVVQILPINDTTQTHTSKDSYPYSSISVYALHPLYLSLDRMGVLQDAALAHEIADQAQQLNNLELLDYDKVDALKWKFFRAIYQQDAEKTLRCKEYKEFYKRNEKWLKPYAIFSYLRDLNQTADFSQWGEWKEYDPKRADMIVGANGGEYNDIALYLFLQFHLDKQLREVRKAAAKMGVALKGDIPIGVNRHSVESWVEPHLFNLSSQAGAPPDAFSSAGQNWGFPTYNWKEMAKDGYLWWRNRFQKMYDYFELYRIDHILGFFRIWEIPYQAIEGTLGYFSPALPLTTQELEQRGLPLKESYTTPTFKKTEINRLFNKDREEITKEFFDQIDPKLPLFKLKDEFRGQRKLRELLQKTNREEIEATLLGITANVLFIAQEIEGEVKYHPRIEAQKTMTYQRLTPQEKEAFDQIYDDFFYHRHNDFWAESAKQKLPSLIGSTPMLTCAEDLGMIPDCVAATLEEMKIITLELERMPKEPGREFAVPKDFPYLSVCTTSTHDMSPIRLWWREMEDNQKQEYYTQMLGRKEEAPVELNIETAKEIVRRNLQANSILAILPLQDLMAINKQTRKYPIENQRINIPSDPNHYWRYRMEMKIEELNQNKDLKNQLKALIKESKRNN